MKHVVILILAFGLTHPSRAQFGRLMELGNPQIVVKLQHAPGLGLSIKRVAFFSAAGECRERVEDQLMERLTAEGIEVIERQQFQGILKEQAISNSDAIDPATAVRLGKLFGPSALISIKVYQCSSERNSLFTTNSLHKRTNISRTTAYFRGSVRAIELATGKVYRPVTLEETVKRENKSPAEEGQPEFPSREETIDEAIRSAATKAGHLFAPWTEERKVVFFDDRDCNLKTAFQILKSGNLNEALQQSVRNLDECKTSAKKPKVLGHAYYNVGLSYLLLDKYDESIAALGDAIKSEAGRYAEITLSEARRAKSLAAEVKRVEEISSAQAPPQQSALKTSIPENAQPPAKLASTVSPSGPTSVEPVAPSQYVPLDDEIGTIIKVASKTATFTVVDGVSLNAGEVLEVQHAELINDPRTGRRIAIGDRIGTISVTDVHSGYVRGDINGKAEVNDRIVRSRPMQKKAAMPSKQRAEPVKAPQVVKPKSVTRPED